MTPNTRWFAATSIAVVVVDQLTKWLVRANLRPYRDEVEVIPNLLSFAHAQNKGAALSAMADFEHRLLVFYAFTVIAAGVIFWTVRQLAPGDRLAAAMLGTLLGGALGNFVDRVVAGEVTDMIKVYAGSDPLRTWAFDTFGTNVYPIFNVADIAIWVGVIGYALPWLLRRDRSTPDDVEGSRPQLD